MERNVTPEAATNPRRLAMEVFLMLIVLPLSLSALSQFAKA
jgi:hypothetical protein